MSVSNFEKTAKVSAILGVNPKHAEAVLWSVRSMPLLPESAKSVLVESALRAGQYQLALLREPNAIGDMKLRLFNRELMTSGGGLKLIFPEYDIFFRYHNARDLESLCKDARVPQKRILNEPTESKRFVETGARFPHIWLSSDEMGSRIFSSVCLPGHRMGKLKFALLVDYRYRRSWSKVCEKLDAFDVFVIKGINKSGVILYDHNALQNTFQNPPHYKCLSKANWPQDSGREILQSYPDELILSFGTENERKTGSKVVFDITGEWASFCAARNNDNTDKIGAVAIRPDGHIAGIFCEPRDDNNVDGSFRSNVTSGNNIEGSFLSNVTSDVNLLDRKTFLLKIATYYNLHINNRIKRD